MDPPEIELDVGFGDDGQRGELTLVRAGPETCEQRLAPVSGLTFLPGRVRIELLHRLRLLNPHLKVLITDGYSTSLPLTSRPIM